jgi:hypothetical protein
MLLGFGRNLQFCQVLYGVDDAQLMLPLEMMPIRDDAYNRRATPFEIPKFPAWFFGIVSLSAMLPTLWFHADVCRMQNIGVAYQAHHSNQWVMFLLHATRFDVEGLLVLST